MDENTRIMQPEGTTPEEPITEPAGTEPEDTPAEEAARQLVKAEMDARRNARNIRTQQEQQAEEQAEQSLQERLASEFSELREECPDVADFDAIPQEVVNDAVKNGRHLYDAYLRYQRREDKKIQQNHTARQTAAAAAIGSQADNPPDGGMDPDVAAMLQGVRSVFN